MSKAAVIGVATGVLLCSLAACGSHHGSGGSAPSVGPLATIPDTAASRHNVVEDDPSWLADPTLMRKQWCRPTRGSRIAQRMALANASPEGSPLGTGLVQVRSPYALVESLQRIDLPLFWQPPFQARS